MVVRTGQRYPPRRRRGNPRARHPAVDSHIVPFSLSWLRARRHTERVRPEESPVASISTSDPDEFAEALLPVSPWLEVTAQSRKFRAGAKLTPLASVGMVQPTIVSARIHKPLLEDVYGLHIPLRSGMEFRMGSRYQLVDPGYAHLTGPTSSFDLRVRGQGDALAVVIPAGLVHAHWVGEEADPKGPLQGEPTVFTLASPAARRFFRVMSAVWGEILTTPTGPKARRDFENGIVECLTQALEPPIDPTGTVRNAKRILDRAKSFIRTRLGHPLTVPEVARAAGTSRRTLYRLFLQEEQLTPLDFIQHERMDFVRRALLTSHAEETTVTTLAVQHGFNHLGRFAAQYRITFGELPSETLRH